jgi:hypothetical protein
MAKSKTPASYAMVPAFGDPIVLFRSSTYFEGRSFGPSIYRFGYMFMPGQAIAEYRRGKRRPVANVHRLLRNDSARAWLVESAEHALVTVPTDKNFSWEDPEHPIRAADREWVLLSVPLEAIAHDTPSIRAVHDATVAQMQAHAMERGARDLADKLVAEAVDLILRRVFGTKHYQLDQRNLAALLVAVGAADPIDFAAAEQRHAVQFALRARADVEDEFGPDIRTLLA